MEFLSLPMEVKILRKIKKSGEVFSQDFSLRVYDNFHKSWEIRRTFGQVKTGQKFRYAVSWTSPSASVSKPALVESLSPRNRPPCR